VRSRSGERKSRTLKKESNNTSLKKSKTYGTGLESSSKENDERKEKTSRDVSRSPCRKSLKLSPAKLPNQLAPIFSQSSTPKRQRPPYHQKEHSLENSSAEKPRTQEIPRTRRISLARVRGNSFKQIKNKKRQSEIINERLYAPMRIDFSEPIKYSYEDENKSPLKKSKTHTDGLESSKDSEEKSTNSKKAKLGFRKIASSTETDDEYKGDLDHSNNNKEELNRTILVIPLPHALPCQEDFDFDRLDQMLQELHKDIET
jgi:hypothetical protein